MDKETLIFDLLLVLLSLFAVVFPIYNFLVN
ncbi:hypothetical protein ACUW8U_002149 [Staphylococcus auricularis]